MWTWLWGIVRKLWQWFRWRRHRPRRSNRLLNADKPPSLRYRVRPKPKWARQEVIRLKSLMSHAGCRTIAHRFNRRWAACRHMTVSKTYVADLCRRHQYLIYEARRKLKHRVPRPMPRNRVWGCDLLTKTDRHGTPHVALAILDHASRACLRLQSISDKSSPRLLHELVQAVKRYGRPHFLRTDNEAVFTSAWFTGGGSAYSASVISAATPAVPGKTDGWNGSLGRSSGH